MSIEVSKLPQGDLAGWQFMEVFEIHKPCAHGSCCDVHGYYLDRTEALRVVKRLFPRVAEHERLTLLTPRTILSRDGKSGILLAQGVGIFRETVRITQPKRAKPPKAPRSQLRLV